MSDKWGPGSPDISLGRSEAITGDSEERERETSETEQNPPEEVPEAPEAETEGSVYDAMRPGEYAFLPVFGFNEANVAARKYAFERDLGDDEININIKPDEPMVIGGKDLTWWEESSIMPKHPFLLVNPLGFASVDPDVRNFRDVFRCAKGDQFVFADSGGYQLMSMEDAEIVDDRADHSFKDYKIYPERLMEWQVENADAGATIDFPPYNISGDSAFPDAAEWGSDWANFFVQRRDTSAKMTERMANRLATLRDEGNEQAEDYIFAPVIHAKPYPDGKREHLVYSWHKEMAMAAEKGGIEPRGWVLKPEPSRNLGQIAMFLGYAYEHLQSADYIHVLMVGGLLQKALLMYYAKDTDHFVTSDASSYAAGGMRRQFNLPKTATRRCVIISSRDDDDDDAAQNPNDLNRYPCRCMVCSTVEDDLGFDFIKEGSGSPQSASMNMHNLHQLLNVERTIDALLREDDVSFVEYKGDPTGSEFWRYVKTVAGMKQVEDLYRAMDYIRIVKEDGLDTANEKYRIKWAESKGVSIDYGVGSGAEVDW